MPSKEQISESFKAIQDRICAGLEYMDGEGKFEEDSWQRDGGGGGRTRVLENGGIIEKGGVNFSEVHGKVTAGLKTQLKTEAESFFATGVSIVMHPNHPQVPIIHMNIRYFELSDGIAWFGGGIDLTPHYINASDAQHFHQTLKTLCEEYPIADYARFKTWADDYFFLPHRNETRGVGGIFYDYLTRDQPDQREQAFRFSEAVGNTFAPLYTQLVKRNRDKERKEEEREWQLIRRGRYVEFNLVHDRGTRFGLVSNGRTESILMSLPNTANWGYNLQPASGTPERQTLDQLKKGVNWLET